MRTRIADLDFTALDAWLAAGAGRCFKLKSFGDEITITVWHAATACGAATGPAATFSDLLASAIAQCDRNQREAEEARAIKEEARRRLAERAAIDPERDGRAAAE